MYKVLKNTTSLLAFISGAVWHGVSFPNARRNGHRLQQRTLQLGIEKGFLIRMHCLGFAGYPEKPV